MVTLLIALGAFVVALVGAAILSPDKERERLMEDVAQPFFWTVAHRRSGIDLDC